MARIAIRAEASGTSLDAQVQRYGVAARQAVFIALQGVQEGALLELRQEIGAAFPGSRRLPTTITGKAYDTSPDGKPPTVWIHPRKGSNIGQVLAAHRGSTIEPKQAGTALAIPTARVPSRAGGRGRMSPDEVARHFGEKLTLVRAKPGSRAWGYLVLKGQTLGRSGKVRRATAGRARQGRAAQPIIMFVLVPRVTLAPRLTPEAIMARWAGLVPTYIERAARGLGIES